MEIYKNKFTEYLERAEYLKKTVLAKPDEQVNPVGGSAQQAKKKYAFSSELINRKLNP